MVQVVIEPTGKPSHQVHIEAFPCQIGRHRNCAVVLQSWRVARHHAQIRREGQFLSIVDQGSLIGTWVNGERIVEYGPLSDEDEILVAGFMLRLVGTAQLRMPHASARAPDDQSSIQAGGVLAVHRGVAQPMDTPTRLETRRRLHRALLDTIDLRRQEVRHLPTDQLRATAREHLLQIVRGSSEYQSIGHRDALINAVLDEAVGLGVLEGLLARDDVSEIMVNGCDPVIVESAGKLVATELRFSSDEAILAVIERIVSPLGRRIDEASPMVDARLPDGSRVNAVIAPLSVRGPVITIRRFNARLFQPDDLLESHTASRDMLDFLAWCVNERRNIVISGGTGSGKTTLLNLLTSYIDVNERLITVEDAAELRLKHPNLVSLEARTANSEGRGVVAIRDLVRNALRMRPDRIVVGECRGGEALDMLQAMNTGHNGSLTTVHANSARDALARLEVMVLMSGVHIPVQAIREQVGSAIDIIVQQARGRDGVRRIIEIAEVTGVEGTQIQTQELFYYQPARDRFVCTGHVPSCFDELAVNSIDPVRAIFDGSIDAAA